MASILRIKRSELSGNPAVLAAGELAYSALTDNGSNGGDRLYIGTGTESGGNAVNHVVIGGKYFTDLVSAATATNTAGTIVKRNSSGAAYLNIIGNVTGDVSGNFTGSITGDVTGNVTGDLTGNVTGNVTGDVTGKLIGDIYASNGTSKVLENGTDGTNALLTANVTGNLTGNVTGNITSTGASSFTNATITGGSINGTTIGATTASTVRGTTITATTGFTGNVTGNVTGNLTGDVTGNLTGTQVSVTNAYVSSLTPGRFVYVGAGDKLVDNELVYFDETTQTLHGYLANFSAITGNLTGNVTGNVTGNITGNADTATRLLTPRNLSLTGDATATLSNFDGSAAISGALTLATVNTNVGSFGSATEIPILTVNGKGLVTAVSTATVATNLSIAGNTGTDTVSLLNDTLTFEGGPGVTTTVTNNKVSIGLSTSLNLNDLAIGVITAGSITVSGAIEAGDTTTANINVNGNAVIAGNLTVQGTTTSVNSTTVAIGDKNIELAKDSTSAINSDGAGITIVGPAVAATITYSAIDNRWNMNKDLNVANVYGALIGNASTATTWANGRNLILTGDASATLTNVNGSANVSAVLTLANTGVTANTYGELDGYTFMQATVNSKGLITFARNVDVPTATYTARGLASFDSNHFSISGSLVSIAQVDGGDY